MARSFDGSTTYLQTDVALLSGSPLSISAWFYTAITTGEVVMFWLGDKDVTNKWLSLNIFNGALGAVHRDSGNTAAANSTAGITVNTWQNAIAVFPSDSSRTIYLDGANSATNSTAQDAVAVDRTAIGRNADSTPGNIFNGNLAEIGVWNRALDASEVAALAKGFPPKHFKRGLVLYLPFVRDIVDIAKGFGFTVNGSPGVVTHPRIYY